MAAQDVQGMLVRIEATTAQLRAEMKRADAAVGNATKGIDKQLSKVDGAFDRLGVGAGKAASAVRALAPALAGLATLEALRRAQQLGEEFTLLEARIKRLSGGTAEAAVTYSRLAEVARQSGTSLGDTVKLWESLTGTLEELGATDAQVVRLTDTLQKIGTIGGSSAQEVSSALRQLGQGLAGGVIRAEEFNSVIEGMPELGREIARGLGVPFGELRQLMLDGELTAEKVLGAIQRRAFDVDAEFAKLPRTVSQASNALTNDFGRAIGEIDKAIGGSVNLARFLDTLAKGIRFTAGDFTDLERLNQLTAERAKLQQSYEQAERRTLLSAKERATFENGLKRLNTEILEIQNRRVQQMKEEGKAIQSNGPAQNEQYDKYLAKLKESAALQGVNSEVAKVRYAIEKGELGKLTEAQQSSLLKYAAEKDAKIAAEKAGLSYTKGLEDQASAIKALTDKYDPAAKAQAEYDAGIKLADESLRNGTYTTEQYQKVVQGLYTDLNKPIWDKHNEAADEAAAAIKKIDDQLQSVRDRLDPAGKAAREFAEEQDFLKKAVDEGRLSLEEYNRLLPLLGKEYEENTRATSEWAQWTEGALDRVDSAFADAWRNIGDGFSSFRDSLTDAFKQMLAELAHMAITKPIIMQLGAAMGIGNGTQGNNGIWGSLLGGSSASGGGGTDILGTVNQARSLYSAYGTASSLWPALSGGYASGGFGGALSAGVSGIGGMFGLGSGAAASMAAGSTAAGYTGAAYASWAAAQGAAGAGAAAAGAGGLGAGMMAKLGAMASNPVGWFIAAITGMYQSGKLFDSGIRISGDKIGDYDDESSILGKVAWAPFRVAATAIEKMDKLIGSVVGDKTAAMITGSPITQFVMEKLGSKLFGGAWETRDVGIGLGVENGALDAQQFEYQKKKGGWFKKDKKRTLWSDLDPETAEALQQTYDATTAGVASIFESLSLTLDEGSLAGLQLAREKISTNGKTEEEIQEAVAEWFVSLGDSMTAELNKVFATGLDLDLAGMQAFVGNLQGVNEVLRYLDVSMYDMTVAGGKLAESLAAASGGLDALATNSQTYYAALFTEAEKTADTIDSIKRAFESADVELVGSREAYRAMVEDIDLTTEAGQEMFATMMALSGQAAQYFSIVEQQAALAEQQTASVYAAAVNAAQGAFNGLQQSINAEIQAAQSGINELSQLASSLESTLKSMRMESTEFDRMRRQQAQGELSSALATARAGGSLRGIDLSSALGELGRANTDLFGSFEEYARDYWRTAHDINDLAGLTDEQLTAEQQVVSNLEQILESAQREMDILTGISSGVMSVADALGNFGQQLGVAKGTPKTNSQAVSSAYVEVLGRSADSAGFEYWLKKLEGGMSVAEMKRQMARDVIGGNSDSAIGASKGNAEDYLKALGIPGFASGGFHSGGLHLVGENGPELEVTGPSRIYNAGQTAAMLGGAGSTEELRALRSEVAGLRSALGAIAKYTESTAYGVRQMNEIGLPQPEAA